MNRAAAFALWAAALSAAPSLAAAPADPAEAIIWSQEQMIYQGRAHGSTTYYVDHASPDYLGWPAGPKLPLDLDALRKGSKAVAGGHEVIHSTLIGFSRDGDTAVIYYRNHRTVRPDGTRVDESYDNIHVWVRRDGKWLVLGSMSRPTVP